MNFLSHPAAIMGLGGGELLLILFLLGLLTVPGAIELWALVRLTNQEGNAGPVEPAGPVRARRKCPDCADCILAGARVGKHGGYRLEAK
jgi:hypothetical protein